MHQTVIQRNDNDCMLAAIATIAQREYDDLWTPEFVKRVVDARGCNTELSTEALKIAGYQDRIDYRFVYLHGHGRDDYVKNLFWGRRAILSVASLNNEHGFHAVAWAYDKLYDVSNKRQYQFMSHLMVETAWIFNERP